VGELEKQITSPLLNPPLRRGGGTQSKYAITRSLKNLREEGFIEQISSPQNEYARPDERRKEKVHSLELDSETNL